MSHKKFILSGGGTGGHIFPAIAIADALKHKCPDAEFLFVGSRGRMEMEIVPRAGYPVVGLWISGLQRKITLQNLSFPVKLISSIVKSRKIIKRFKPDLVIGVGGYSSGPVVYAAASMGIPTLIQEQNSYPGITNRWLSKKVRSICVAFDGMERFFPKEKIIVTGNPVREEAIGMTDKDEAARFFHLSSKKTTLLVLGGSLGARTINESIAGGLEELMDSGAQLIWQTGKAGIEKAEHISVRFAREQIAVREFITKMHYAYALADLVIARAGAITVSELCLTGKASILVPSPNVAEDHQTKNALELIKRKAAFMVPDEQANQILVKTAVELLQDEQKRKQMSLKISEMAKPGAADAIAHIALKMLSR